MPVSVKIGGTWKTATAVFNKVGGAWKTASDMPVKIGGTWKTGILASGAFESIATVTASGGESSLTFSSIPSTYKHLQIRGIGRCNISGTRELYVQLNGDTSSSSYAWHAVYGGSGTVDSSAMYGGSINRVRIGEVTGPSATTSTFSATIVDILDYSNTSKYKTFRYMNGYNDNAGYESVSLGSGLWMSTSVINTIDIIPITTTFAAGSTFALYGIKGE